MSSLGCGFWGGRPWGLRSDCHLIGAPWLISGEACLSLLAKTVPARPTPPPWHPPFLFSAYVYVDMCMCVWLVLRLTPAEM